MDYRNELESLFEAVSDHDLHIVVKVLLRELHELRAELPAEKSTDPVTADALEADTLLAKLDTWLTNKDINCSTQGMDLIANLPVMWDGNSAMGQALHARYYYQWGCALLAAATCQGGQNLRHYLDEAATDIVNARVGLGHSISDIEANQMEALRAAIEQIQASAITTSRSRKSLLAC